MSQDTGEILSGPVANRVAGELIRELLEMATKPGGLLQAYMEPYPFKTQPTTLRSLLAMDPPAAAQKLETMIRNPQQTKEALEMLPRYRDAMAKKEMEAQP